MVTGAALERNGVPPALTAAFLLLAAAAVLAGYALQYPQPQAAIVPAGLAVTTLCVALILLLTAVCGPGLRTWRTGPWMLAWSAGGFGLATLAWSSAAQVAGSAAAQVTPSFVLAALWLVAAALLAWTAGYLTGPLRRAGAALTRSLDRRLTSEVRSGAPWVLYLTGTVGRAATEVTSGHLGYLGSPSAAVSSASGYGQVLALAGMLAPLGLAAAALRVFRQRRSRVTLVVLLAAELGYSAVSGDKLNFAVAVLAVIVPFTVVRGRLPKGALAIAAAAFLLVVIPFTAAYRAADRDGRQTATAAQAIAAAPAVARQAVGSEAGVLTVAGQSVWYLLQRDQDIDSPAVIMERTPGQIPYSSPADLVAGPLTELIPRALWPGKPVLTTGYDFGQEYLGLPPSVYSSTTITPEGDLYRHGGWPPVIAGMFLLGALMRLLDDGLDAANPHALFLLLLVFPPLVMAEQDWVTLLGDLPTLLLTGWVAARLAFRPDRRRR
jgi:hypothetical protein